MTLKSLLHGLSGAAMVGAMSMASGLIASSQASAATPGLAHAALWPKAQSRGLVDAGTEAFVTELMSHMTLEEKVGQMIQADTSTVRPSDLDEYPLGSILAGGNSPPMNAPDRSPVGPWLATAQAFRAASIKPRPGRQAIPVIFGIDAVHGHGNVIGATVFPHNIALGAADDPDLIRRITAATAEETAATGIDWAFGPTLAVPRDVRWGRSYEGYSEDPEIVARYAGPAVIGLQGEPGMKDPLQHGHVAGSAKHFLGDGGTHDGHDQGDAQISEAELIRIHAQGYPAAIDAGVMTVMVSFSSWQGVKMTGNKSLLTDVLKGQMGFEGFVITDWNAQGQVPGCTNESCAAAINDGIDMLMAPDSWKGLFRNTIAQVKSGEIPMSRIDDAVRRILRVKKRLGLFEAARPYESKPEVVGSTEHRALAREAVRKSIVLLKNNGGVLPIASNAHVLVAGPGADDIGMQSGGWTLSWQGTGNHNSDFPNGESIYAGIAEAMEGGGGSAELSTDGSFQHKPDVAIVVYGETPYAEGWGDISTLVYHPGDDRDLQMLKRLKAQGIPVVSLFLSGRPLWVNPEINASDAFVAAWQPGTEGAGIADVIIGTADGKPRRDFHGKLSFSWPRLASQTTLNRGDAHYDPLFAYGYGLHYTDQKTVTPLSEDPGVAATAANFANYLINGRAPEPYSLILSSGSQSRAVPATENSASVGALSMSPVDASGVQEGGRQFKWTGPGRVAIQGPAIDLSMQTNGEASLRIDYRVDAAPTGKVTLGQACGDNCGVAMDFGARLRQAPTGKWQSVKIRLACLRTAGVDVSKITQPFVLGSDSAMTLSISSVQLTSDPEGAVCKP